MGPRSLHIAQAIASLSHHFVTGGHENNFLTEQRTSMRANLLCNLNIKCTFSTRWPTSFPGFSPTCPTERERETLGKNPGNEVTRRSKILESFKAENVMSMRELVCPDPLAGFEKMAGFQIFYCLKIKCFHS